MDSQSIKLNTGAEMPVLGLGTWLGAPGTVGDAVKVALDQGYKHIDCAYRYNNEQEIGQALAEKIDTVIKRKDLFVTSKLWLTMMEPKLVRESLQMSLRKLNVDYLDLFLIHWPHAVKFRGHDNPTPKDENGNFIFADIDYKDTWRAMEELVDEGLIKAIGVSNFNTIQVDDILQNCSIKPAVNQFEAHPYMTCNRWIDHFLSKDISVTVHSPLGSPNRPGAVELGYPVLLNDPVLKSIGDKYGKSPAQVCIRFAIQRGLVAIPKSTTPSRIIENSQVEDLDILIYFVLIYIYNIILQHKM